MFEFATDDDRAALQDLCDSHDDPNSSFSDTITTTVTSALASSIIPSPSRSWAVLRRLGHKPKTALPQAMRASPSSAPVSSVAEVSKIWCAPFSRPKFVPQDADARSWASEVEAQVNSRRLLIDPGEWGYEPFTMKEFKDSLASTNSNGAPGVDFLTCQMFENAGNAFQLFLLNFYNVCFSVEDLPLQFLFDMIMALYKRGSRYLATNYRPVSLMLVACKHLQKVAYNRVEIKSLTMPGGGLAGPYQFGSIRGRDRLLLLWSLNASCIVAAEKGSSVFVAAWDVSNAFPSL